MIDPHIFSFLCVTGQVTDAMLSHAGFIYPENTPTTKEAYYYRTIFERFFPKVDSYVFLFLLSFFAFLTF